MNPKPSIRFVALALIAFALAPGLVRAQLQPGINPLAGNATMGSGAQTPSQMGPGGQPQIYGDKLPDRGWDGLAKLLEAISPSYDTRVPPSATDIARRIESLLAANRSSQALEEIDKYQAAEAGKTSPGTDVQIMFLRARTLAALDRVAEAEIIYRQMTMRFPELPEPWNNLAAIYASRDDLDQARRALETSIMIYPDYAIAHANLGDIQLKLALRAYQRAADLGVTGGIRSRIQGVNAMLTGQPFPTDAAPRVPPQNAAATNPAATNPASANTATSAKSTNSSNVTRQPETTAK
ncbi:MAG: hypothetical protein WCP99_12730 [Burkholderiales bacterium]